MKLAFSKILAFDQRLSKLAQGIEILDRLQWPIETKVKFLQNWHKGTPKLPKHSYPKVSLRPLRLELKDLKKRCKKSGEPLVLLIGETASNYETALKMLECTGTALFQELSQKIYGYPKEAIASNGTSTYRAAVRYLRSLRRFNLEAIAPKEEFCITPQHVVEQLTAEAKKHFPHQEIAIITDKNLASKAAAGANRIRVRDATCFATHDVQQLIHHELLVHTLTLQNGRQQRLAVLGMNSPRTTCTQEGLAVFAEFFNNAMDVVRLRRIASRVQAIQMGMDGADFLEVFRFFLSQGQSEEESYHSSQRIFRGGKIKGGIVFTKDMVYLKGFLEVHQFFLNSIKDEKFMYPHYLFAGRFKTSDIEMLAPYFEAGHIKLPTYEPEWITNRSTLLAFLLSSSVMYSLGLSKV